MTATERKARQETWAEKIAEFGGSGLRGAIWCTARSLKEQQQSYWRRKLKYQAEQKEIS